jgi:ABC-2 type transport system permease protein
MLRNAWFIARKDVYYTLRERETILWLFIMPIIFFYFVGTITRGFGPRGASKQPLAVRAPADAGFLADELMERLEKAGYEVLRPESEQGFAESVRRLTIPDAFTEAALAGTPVTVRLARKDAGLSEQYDRVRVGRAVYTVLADLVASTASGAEPSAESFQRLREMPRTVEVAVESGGKRQRIPTGFEQAIPGTMVQFTLMVLLTSGTALLVIERDRGLLRRLASTPIARGEVVLGKWGGRLALGLVQIGFAMVAGTLLFSMDWGPNLPMVVIVLASWGAFCASAALLVGSLARTVGQAVGIGILMGNALAALGGCWWPIEITPGWMQTLARFLPTGWAMGAMHKLISFQAGPMSALPHVLEMCAAALALGWLASRRFRFQ